MDGRNRKHHLLIALAFPSGEEIHVLFNRHTTVSPPPQAFRLIHLDSNLPHCENRSFADPRMSDFCLRLNPASAINNTDNALRSSDVVLALLSELMCSCYFLVFKISRSCHISLLWQDIPHCHLWLQIISLVSRWARRLCGSNARWALEIRSRLWLEHATYMMTRSTDTGTGQAICG